MLAKHTSEDWFGHLDRGGEDKETMTSQDFFQTDHVKKTVVKDSVS